MRGEIGLSKEYIVEFDDCGNRIPIPEEIVCELDLDRHSQLKISTECKRIIIEKIDEVGCIGCGIISDELLKVSGITICRDCAEKVYKHIGYLYKNQWW